MAEAGILPVKGFLRFATVGAIGFLVDAGGTVLLSSFAHLSPSTSRLIALPLALVTTFLLNRLTTFPDRKVDPVSSLLIYLVTQSVGAGINFLIYLGLIYVFPTFGLLPAVAAGSACALMFNFVAADRLAFSENSKHRGLVLNSTLALMGAGLLLWPAILNHSPFIFFDTAHYVGLGKSILRHATGLAAPSGPASAAVDTSVNVANAALTYAGGRSPFYSVPVYLLSSTLGFWPIAILQAWVASFVIWIVTKHTIVGGAAPVFLSIVGVLAFASPLAFFADMLMPDLFAGICLAGLAALLFLGSRMTKVEIVSIVFLTGFAASTHASTLALALIVLAGCGAWLLIMQKGRSLRLLYLPTVALSGAIAMTMAFDVIVAIKTGSTPKTPPYITARLLADGPGRALLAHRCGSPQAYALCAFKDRQFVTQDDFLWSGDPSVGVFSVVDLQSRQLIKAEEMRFALDALMTFPLEVSRAALANGAAQLVHFGVVSDFSQQTNSWDKMNFPELLPNITASFTASKAYRGRIFFDGFDIIIQAAALGALAALLLLVRRDAALRSPLTLLVICLFANAIICGAVSGVNDRYQARLEWLLPLLALIAIARTYLSRDTSAIDLEIIDADKSRERAGVERASYE